MITEHLIFIQNQETNTEQKIPRSRLVSPRRFPRVFSCHCDRTPIHGSVDNEKEITQHTNELIDTVDTDHQDLIITTNNTRTLSADLKIMKEQIQLLSQNFTPNTLKQTYALAQQTWIYIYYNYYHDNVSEVRRNITTAVNSDDKGFNPHTPPLCLILRATVNSDQSLDVYAAFSKKPTLRATCTFICINEKPMPFLAQKFLVPNIHTYMKVVRPHQKTQHYIQITNNTRSSYSTNVHYTTKT
ncbi:hypothetical protein J6590_087830 [Homalodisca vitripennis]|nr:hypothetical protein J6590_087830 [Homalodisca vitripennis]